MQLVPINTEDVRLNPAHNSIQHYMIKSVSDLRQVSVFLQGTAASSTNKTDHHNITEILLKMALSTIPPLHITSNCCLILNEQLVIYIMVEQDIFL
jgi:hypothetical protein